MDQQMIIIDQQITSLMSLLAILVSFYAAYNVKNIEREKSKLKKAEILFNMQVEAVKEFNRIYHEFNPLNLGETHNNNFYNNTLSKQLKSRIAKYQADYAFLLEDNEIIKKLKGIMRLLDPIAQEHSYYGGEILYKKRDEEVKIYIDILREIGDTNSLIKKYMFQEIKGKKEGKLRQIWHIIQLNDR